MTSRITRLTQILLAVLLILAFAGCEELLQEEPDPTGTVQGSVISATTGSGISGATIRIQGHSDFDTTSGSGGSFSITSPTGSQTLVIEYPGYVFNAIPINVSEDQTTTVGVNQTVGSPDVTQGGVRMVLTWGSSVRDLDSHLLTPQGQEVYFGSRTPTGAGAGLDTDDTSYYGPETITITSGQTGGSYVYWIYNWSNEASLSSSSAVVQLYDSTGLVRTLSVPSSGSGRYWEVLRMTYDGSSYNTTISNQIVASEPTN